MEIEQIETALHGADPQFVDQVRVAALTEQERQANLAAIPDQIEQLAKVYRAAAATSRCSQMLSPRSR